MTVNWFSVANTNNRQHYFGVKKSKVKVMWPQKAHAWNVSYKQMDLYRLEIVTKTLSAKSSFSPKIDVWA